MEYSALKSRSPESIKASRPQAAGGGSYAPGAGEPVGDAAFVVTAHQDDGANRRRLRWRARRGLLENDLVLTRFLDRHESSLSDEDVAGLHQLLDETDNDLLDLILARSEPQGELDTPDVKRVLGLLRGV